MNSHIKSYLDANRIPYEINVDLKKKTWIHRGGIAGIYITPESSEELEKVVLFLYRNNIKFLLVGHTSNIYILNSCNIPVVISTIKCRNYIVKDNKVYCEAGVGVIQLSKQMIQNGYKGFEYLTGLPGTVGAALVNNSSCKSNSISELLIIAKVVLSDGTIKYFNQEDFKYDFRTSIFKNAEIQGVILSAELLLQQGNIDELTKISKDNIEDRNRYLGHNSKNLGCTVNRCFINGNMPMWIQFFSRLYYIIIRLFVGSRYKRRELVKNFICWISGYKSVAPYINSNSIIIFMWLDGEADNQFPRYLEFMKKVYKTDKVEIQIIK